MQRPPRAYLAALSLGFLLLAPALARGASIGAVGDSLTDQYAPWLAQFLTPMPQLFPTDPQPSGPDPMNWVEQIAEDRAAELDFGAVGAWPAPRLGGEANDWALGGATTTTLLAGGQHTGVAAQGLDLVYVGIGTNNFAPAAVPSAGLVDVYGGIHDGCQSLTSCSTPFTGSNGLLYASVEDYVADVLADIATAVSVIDASGASIVLGTVADWGDLPSSRVSYPIGNGGAYADPAGRQLVSDAVALLDAGIVSLAFSSGIPVVDVHALLAAGDGSLPLSLGGVPIQPGAPGGARDATFFFLPDGTHPDTLVQGIFANAVIEAANAGYALGLTPLGDDEILANAGLAPEAGWNGISFDASAFVLVPEPSGALLVLAGLCAGAASRRRRAVGA